MSLHPCYPNVFYVNSCCFLLLKYCSRCCTWITSSQNLQFVHMIVVLQLRGDENICDLKHRENWQVIKCLFCPQGLCTNHVTETMNWSCIVCWSFKQMAPVLTASEISGGKGRVKAFMAFVSAGTMFPLWLNASNAFVRCGFSREMFLHHTVWLTFDPELLSSHQSTGLNHQGFLQTTPLGHSCAFGINIQEGSGFSWMENVPSSASLCLEWVEPSEHSMFILVCCSFCSVPRV